MPEITESELFKKAQEQGIDITTKKSRNDIRSDAVGMGYKIIPEKISSKGYALSVPPFKPVEVENRESFPFEGKPVEAVLKALAEGATFNQLHKIAPTTDVLLRGAGKKGQQGLDQLISFFSAGKLHLPKKEEDKYYNAPPRYTEKIPTIKEQVKDATGKEKSSREGLKKEFPGFTSLGELLSFLAPGGPAQAFKEGAFIAKSAVKGTNLASKIARGAIETGVGSGITSGVEEGPKEGLKSLGTGLVAGTASPAMLKGTSLLKDVLKSMSEKFTRTPYKAMSKYAQMSPAAKKEFNTFEPKDVASEMSGTVSNAHIPEYDKAMDAIGKLDDPVLPVMKTRKVIEDAIKEGASNPLEKRDILILKTWLKDFFPKKEFFIKGDKEPFLS
jgi:hypothetical protein